MHKLNLACTITMACFVTSTPVASAALVSLRLAPADAATNRLTISLPAINGQQTTDLSGDIQADITIDETTGVISKVTFNGGLLMGSNWVMTTNIGNISGTDIGAELTSLAPDQTVTNGTFAASQHKLTLNTGLLVFPGGNQNFATQPFDISGDGTGTLTSTAAGPGLFNVAMTINVNEDDTIGTVPVNIAGKLVANGIVAVPEPTQGLLLTAFAAAAIGRRRSRK